MEKDNSLAKSAGSENLDVAETANSTESLNLTPTFYNPPNPQNPPKITRNNILSLQRTVGNRMVMRMLGKAAAPKSPLAATIQRDLTKVKQMDDVYYGKTAPLTEAEGRTLLTQLNERSTAKTEGALYIYSKLATVTTPKPKEFKVYWEWEWGLGKDKESDEVVLIHGGPKGVEWGPYLQYLIPLAHAHPSGEKRRINVDNVDMDKPMAKPEVSNSNSSESSQQVTGEKTSSSEESTKPSEKLPSKVTLTTLLNGSNLTRLMVFPSASDVQFSACQNVPKHSVFTPYFCKNIGTDSEISIHDTTEREPSAKVPYLNFDIINATQFKNTNYYHCDLVLNAGPEPIATLQKVWADLNLGGHSTLYLPGDTHWQEIEVLTQKEQD